MQLNSLFKHWSYRIIAPGTLLREKYEALKELLSYDIRCHEEMAEGMANSQYIHKAVEETSCTSCHNPHSAPSAKLLQKDIEELCMDCHGDIGRKVKKAKVKHAALYRDEKCSACHANHFSSYPGLLKQAEQAMTVSAIIISQGVFVS